MLPPVLEERFMALLTQAKDPELSSTAREQLAAAKELIDTAFALGYLMEPSLKAYRSICTTVGIIISVADMQRTFDLPVTSQKFTDDLRAVQS